MFETAFIQHKMHYTADKRYGTEDYKCHSASHLMVQQAANETTYSVPYIRGRM